MSLLPITFFSIAASLNFRPARFRHVLMISTMRANKSLQATAAGRSSFGPL
jgi:hypothetical protein